MYLVIDSLFKKKATCFKRYRRKIEKKNVLKNTFNFEKL